MSNQPPHQDRPSGNGRNGSHRDQPHAQPGHGREGMWLSDLSIRQPVFIVMFIAAVVLVGLISYSRLAVNLMPDASLQVISIHTVYPGAAPGEIERSVTKPLEDAVVSISGVKNLRSTSSEGSSQVSVEFDSDVDIKTAAEEVRNRVGLIRNSLPADVLEPVVQKTDTSAIPIIAFAVADRSGARSLEELRSFVDNELKPDMERLEGVGSVMVTGGLIEEVHVETSLDRLLAYGISTQQVVQALRGESVNLPAGRVSDGPAQEVLLRTDAKVQSLEQMGDVPVSIPGGGAVSLKDLADISLSHADVRSHSRLNGNDSIMVIVMKQSGSNTVRVAETVQERLKAVQAQYPEMSFGTVFDQSSFTKEAINDVQLTLLMGGLLAALVVLLFFRDIRNTLVTVAGLPVVVLGTFIVLHAVGISLNMISMMALSLSVGLLIDDAIVVRENIFRHMEMGDEPRTAARKGAGEIALAVLAVTSTIIAVFAPIAFTGGMVGMFLRDFGLTVSAAVLISLIEAFTLAPMLSAYFFHRLSPEQEAARRRGRFYMAFEALNRGYGRFLNWSLNHRRIVVAVGVAAMVASVALVPLMSQSFQAATDQGEFAVMMELPPGASLQEADGVAREAEQILHEEPLVTDMFTSVGSSGGAANSASIGVKLKARGQTSQVLDRVRVNLASALPGVKLSFNPSTAAAGAVSGANGMSSLPIQYKVQGPDFDQLDRVSSDLAAKLGTVPGVVDVDRSAREGGPQRAIVLDRARATDLGISAVQLASTVRSLVNGENAGSFQSADGDLNIVVRLTESDRSDIDKILSLPVTTTRGTQLPISAVASMTASTGPAKIDRENRQRQVLVGANVVGSDPGPALAAAEAAVSSVEVPAGATIKPGGQAEQTAEAFSSLGMALALSVVFMYMILASQFGSFIHPFTIMLALPFSVVGALLALLMTGFSLDAMSMIGIILLMGLVTKNSILLVEFINQLKSRGHSTYEAILHAGPVRLRPILMTTLAMIFGMMPVAVGFGAGSELRQPMGITVIGGVITSTVLTLVAVPVAYSLIDDAGRWLRARLRRTGASEHASGRDAGPVGTVQSVGGPV